MNEMRSRELSGKEMGYFRYVPNIMSVTTVWNSFSDLQLKMLLLDLFFAGSETTVIALVVYLLNND